MNLLCLKYRVYTIRVQRYKKKMKYASILQKKCYKTEISFKIIVSNRFFLYLCDSIAGCITRIQCFFIACNGCNRSTYSNFLPCSWSSGGIVCSFCSHRIISTNRHISTSIRSTCRCSSSYRVCLCIILPANSHTAHISHRMPATTAIACWFALASSCCLAWLGDC